MFTGIIEGLGSISAIQASGAGKRITVDADFILEKTKIGDSIAVSGACLTAVAVDGRRFQADISPETLAKTTFGQAKTGDRVNLERALILSDRLDGHLVSGHIDGMGSIQSKKQVGNAILVSLALPPWMSRYIIPKGSVSVDGVSLTVNACSPGRFEVSIIPHTATLTTIGLKPGGEAVNIETDMIGKYVERFVALYPGASRATRASSIDMNLLAKTGFLNTTY
jgi:riboflavin synthase